jgi:hypothetical protein
LVSPLTTRVPSLEERVVALLERTVPRELLLEEELLLERVALLLEVEPLLLRLLFCCCTVPLVELLPERVALLLPVVAVPLLLRLLLCCCCTVPLERVLEELEVELVVELERVLEELELLPPLLRLLLLLLPLCCWVVVLPPPERRDWARISGAMSIAKASIKEAVNVINLLIAQIVLKVNGISNTLGKAS